MEAKCTGAGNDNVGCGAKLQIGQADLYKTMSYSYDGSSDSYITFMCPCCGAETDVKVPGSVKLLGAKPGKEEKERLVRNFNKSIRDRMAIHEEVGAVEEGERIRWM